MQKMSLKKARLLPVPNQTLYSVLHFPHFSNLRGMFVSGNSSEHEVINNLKIFTSNV